MQVITLTRKTTTRLEQVKLIVSVYCLLTGIKLSDTELTIFSYFIIYKITEETKQLIFRSKLIENSNTYKNILSKLKRLKLIDKNERREYYVSINALQVIDSVAGMVLKIDNT